MTLTWSGIRPSHPGGVICFAKMLLLSRSWAWPELPMSCFLSDRGASLPNVWLRSSTSTELLLDVYIVLWYVWHIISFLLDQFIGLHIFHGQFALHANLLGPGPRIGLSKKHPHHLSEWVSAPCTTWRQWDFSQSYFTKRSKVGACFIPASCNWETMKSFCSQRRRVAWKLAK